MNTTFYPGPSKVYPQVPKYVKKAYKKGILSINHRSALFESIYAETEKLLKKKLKIPASYAVFFTSSATECWEIIAQSFTRSGSYHLFNGAFGEKWFTYAQRIKPESKSFSFDIQEVLNPVSVSDTGAEIICITQNETSNGTQVHNELIRNLKDKNPGSLIAVDATSSMAGIYLDFEAADIWFASVQKCFGLPAGMAVLICSPRSIENAIEINEYYHYNSILFINENAQRHQTHYTPNVLNIYLLNQVMKQYPGIEKIDKKIKKMSHQWTDFFQSFHDFELLSNSPEVRSDTVLTIQGESTLIDDVKKQAEKKGIIIGNGYGKWKQNTFRIANFPAISKKEIKKLQKFLAEHYV